MIVHGSSCVYTTKCFMLSLAFFSPVLSIHPGGCHCRPFYGGGLEVVLIWHGSSCVFTTKHHVESCLLSCSHVISVLSIAIISLGEKSFSCICLFGMHYLWLQRFIVALPGLSV